MKFIQAKTLRATFSKGDLFFTVYHTANPNCEKIVCHVKEAAHYSLFLYHLKAYVGSDVRLRVSGPRPRGGVMFDFCRVLWPIAIAIDSPNPLSGTLVFILLYCVCTVLCLQPPHSRCCSLCSNPASLS